MIDPTITLGSQVGLPAGLDIGTVSSLASHVLTSEGVDEDWHVGIQFVDDATMRAAHAEFMDIDEPTDIMTFPYADEDNVWGDSEAGGDLMISIDTARENAAEADWTLNDELFLLIAHGLLHLLGWDDQAVDDRAAMLARQKDLMDTWVGRP